MGVIIESMSARRLVRLVLCIAVLGVMWMRAAQSGWSQSWVFGGVVLTVVLLIAVGVEISQARKGYRRPSDDVPKHPLGLD